MADDLTRAETHFEFGRNWAEYAKKVGEVEIYEAVSGLSRLLDSESLAGKVLLDIGCGSGLHALAAIRLGARRVVGVDIDADSVSTTRSLLEKWAPNADVVVEEKSVFDLDEKWAGSVDVVYSWGVLHHTGNLDAALRSAAELVAPGGLFVFALYRRIWMDWFWRMEKRWYTQASPSARRRARALFILLFRMGLLVTGRSYAKYLKHYHGNRGMDFHHDVHDWMGGWPYESISPGEVESTMRALGFEPVRSFVNRGRLLGRNLGIFGSGCDEYVYRRSRE